MGNNKIILERVKLMMSYQMGKTLTENKKNIQEQVFQGNSPEEKLANEISFHSYHSNEKELADAINKITSAAQYWNINSSLTKTEQKSIVDCINSGFGRNDVQYVKIVADHLTKLGFKVNNGIENTVEGMATSDRDVFTGKFSISGGGAPNTNSTPSTTNPTRQGNINTMYCSVKGGKIIQPASSFNNIDWVSYVQTYKPTANELAIAAKACPESELAKKQASSGVAKTNFIPNEKMPLKFQQKGENIKMMQERLGVKPTGNFWTATEAAVKKAAPEYTREAGVTQEIFDKIMGISGGNRAKSDLSADLVRTNVNLPEPTVNTPTLPSQPTIQNVNNP